ncbi:MAG TPA: FeoA family protein [Spirochaetota bacterium]|nr:FeoA family protein [Spirochaetota bacterium]
MQALFKNALGLDAHDHRLEAEGVLKKRLIELGFRRGASIALVRYAPLQDPLQVTIQKYSISLRVEEARAVIVKLKAKTVE